MGPFLQKKKKNQFQKESRIQTDHLSSLVTAKLKSPVWVQKSDFNFFAEKSVLPLTLNSIMGTQHFKNQALDLSAKAYCVESWYYLEWLRWKLNSATPQKGNYGQH